MHKLAGAFRVSSRQLAQEVGEGISRVASEPVVPLKLCSRPADGPFGANIEAIGIKQGALIMVAQQNHAAAIANDAGTLTWVRAIAHHVTKAEDFFCGLLFDILQHRLEGLEVAVDVANNGPLHALLQLWRKVPRVS